MVVDINNDRSENVKYDYPDFPICVRRALLSIYPNYAADSHWHDDIELMLILSGKMLYNVNGEIVTLNAGEGIVVNTRQFHYGFSDDMTECDYICILFHPIILCTAKSFEREFVEPVISSGISHFHLSPEVERQSRILKYIKDIYDCRNEHEAPLYTQGYLCSLWSHLLSFVNNGENPKAQSNTKLTTLKSMIDYIHRHYSEKVTLEQIAGAGNVSKRTCGTIFLQFLNKTPMEFLIDYRLRKAIQLMKTTDKTMLDISLEVGFSGPSYFSETFRKNFGITPTEYRAAKIAQTRF